jgi:hypothetical protein
MAEGERSPLDAAGDQLLAVLLGFYIVLQLITGATARIEESTGIDIFHPIESYRALTTLNADSQPPIPVRVTDGTDVFENADGGRLLGFQPEGAEGTIIRGPGETDFGRVWEVDFTAGPDGWVQERNLENASPLNIFDSVVTVFIALSIVVSLILFGVAVYVSIRAGQIQAERRRRMEAAMPTEPEVERNERWERIVEHSGSTNPNDWRAAIIEADVILDEMVTRMGYRGDSLGEKLKKIDRSDFITIDSAWEAHKTRNRIAHAGSDYILTQREAQRIIELYRQVFDEFYYI